MFDADSDRSAIETAMKLDFEKWMNTSEARASACRERRNRRWDDATLKQVIDQIICESDLGKIVTDDLSATDTMSFVQEAETNFAFLLRLMYESGIVFSDNGRLRRAADPQ